MCVDLSSPSGPTLEAPYMQSIHSSAIITITQVTKQARPLTGWVLGHIQIWDI